MISRIKTRLRQRRSAKALPADTYANLVGSLFGTMGSFISAMLAGLIGPTVAYIRTGHFFFAYLAAALCLATAFRVYIMVAYKARGERHERNIAQWELLYALGAISFMLLIGINGAALIWIHADRIAQFFGLIILLGCIGAIAGRNAARPSIVVGQVVALTLPLCVAFWREGGGWNIGLSALMILIMVSVISTTKFLNRHLLKAILSSREEKIQKERFDTALNNMAQGLCMSNGTGSLSVVNRRFTELFDIQQDLVGSETSELAQKIVSSLQAEEFEGLTFVAGFERFIAHPNPGVFTVAMKDHIYDFKCERMTDGGLLIVAEDVTEMRIAARKIEHMAMFDSLTGLPNRFQFRNQMQEASDRIVESGGFSVLYIDLDRFKEVNDTLGHPIGDKLLVMVAQRLRNALKRANVVARFGGDEFVVLIDEVLFMSGLEVLCKRVIDTLSAPYRVDEHMIIIGASIGTATAPHDGRSADDIIKKADMALYHAKASGRGCYSHFTISMDERAREKRQIENELRDAIRNNELEVFYQPIVNSRTGKIKACEALLRWHRADGTFTQPSVFIPIAEETGQIVEIGNWVLNRACQDAAAWPEDIRVAVNFSAVQFHHGRVVEIVKSALQNSGLAANRLEVEVTETTVIQNADATTITFEELAQLGVRLALDDFGSGYSSLSYLNRFPFHKIKIDRSFVRELNDPKSAAVISAVRHLSDILGLSLVVEGVETKNQLTILSAGGACDIQGFLFSEPRPYAALKTVLASGYIKPDEEASALALLNQSVA
ncbi:putative bifunctional diguanylate cyclase/phosphodiesterase [Aestuariivirga litoralis]|uniref:putative bifunctional diguanylate cyclase/phosphodiesterase n=1 Tax=Aestuariivirga litoralis TaxID=2650924 RepID=UPI0018C72027|nr:EAL domain-containing protein [Aestuariivirga litoralis]MBG1233583.1 EAL domain-containing protein [Aestuariivirga litoralis]